MIEDLFGPRLHLRVARRTDVETVHALLTHPQVRRYLCDDQVFPPDRVEEMFRATRPHAPDGLGWWMVERADEAIGLVALLPVSATVAEQAPYLAGEIEPTVALWPSHWGQGFAAEALAALHRHAFGTLELARLVAITDAPNTASQAMLARAGYVKTGECPGPAWTQWLYRLDAPA